MVPLFLQNPGICYCSTHFLLIFYDTIPSPSLQEIILYTLKPPVIQLSISRLPQGLFQNFSFILYAFRSFSITNHSCLLLCVVEIRQSTQAV